MPLVRRAPALAILAFWAIMTGLLFQREVFPRYSSPEGFREVLLRPRGPSEIRIGVFRRDRRVGTASSRMERGAGGAFRIRSIFQGELELFGGAYPVSSAADVRIGPDGRLSGMSLDLSLAGTEILRATGTAEGNVLRLVDESRETHGFRPREIEIPLDQGLLFSSLLNPLAVSPKPVVGKQWMLQGLNPITLKPFRGYMEVVREEGIEVAGRRVRAFRVELKREGFPLAVWLDAEGEFLRQELPFFGIRLDREAP